MKNREDFTPDNSPPSSIRQIVEEQLAYTSYNGKTNNPLEIESIDDMLKRVYAKIESEALKIFKSNEPWALKAFCYSTILKDTVASEVTESMVEEMMSPVLDWQNKSFDPIAYFKERLDAERKRDYTKWAYLQTAARFVAREGRHLHYSDGAVEDFQKYANKKYWPGQGRR